MEPDLYPLLFKPVYKDYLWGGDRIVTTFHRDAPRPGVYAESWEISDREDGMSVVANGALAGTTLADVVSRWGPRLQGEAPESGARFPLLVKLIDARERLSVQVHPDDDTAARFGGEPKTEMWYLLAADPGAAVFAGLRSGVGRHAFLKAVEKNELEDLLVSLPVQQGDAVFMRGGRVHAIDAGCLILEVQQNSNTTYRIYDWGRAGPDGQPRPLHLEQALDVVRFEDDESARVTPRRLGFLGENELWEVLSCPYFRVEKLLLNEPWPTPCDGSSFHALFVSRGTVELCSAAAPEALSAGATCLVPAGMASYELKPGPAPCEVLRVTVP